VLVDCGCTVEGYVSDITRTIILVPNPLNVKQKFGTWKSVRRLQVLPLQRMVLPVKM